MSVAERNNITETWESIDYEPSLPVSEKSNPLSRDLDRASANQIVRILQACDMQMFEKEDSNGQYQRILSDSVLKSVMEVALRVEEILKNPENSLIVLSGCGTSGRLAFLITRCFNKALKQLSKQSVYTYIIAGGDRALFTSKESHEDDPKMGMLHLKEVCEGKKHVLYIGISCGLSAPFVAGQLDFCLQHLNIYTPVLIGFNPANQTRSDPMQGCTFTFYDVVQRMQEAATHQKAFIINPAVGPEALSGSSRMKGGSATKILLEVILQAAHGAAFAHRPITPQSIHDHMDVYVKCLDLTYAQPEYMATMIKSAGESLQSGRHVCYLGWDSLGILGLIDASECISTFGADYHDIRGFVSGGFSALDNNEGPLTSLVSNYRISHEDFLNNVLPSLNDKDTVILLYTEFDDQSEVSEISARVREKNCKLHSIVHCSENGSAVEKKVEINSLTGSDSLQRMQWELTTKLTLNAISTGAHVLKGKIYQNYMIDLQVTNSKLYRRAARLLQKFSGQTEIQCHEALLKAIYEVEELNDSIKLKNIFAHTKIASKRSKIVPLALVCLLTGCSLVEAGSSLENQPIIRDAVTACLTQNKHQNIKNN
ncbi:glucokinase regulatory protein [Boleophthalmus pectinirostris]|uniref:glucokinase regulatory protein n=1 Tax=Boleophthalmus pectinirostris TaxID=150288 RepID=UPI002431ED9C|nr:glucokinase regulatory protein [Boleophthalmus pectinirostris]